MTSTSSFSQNFFVRPLELTGSIVRHALSFLAEIPPALRPYARSIFHRSSERKGITTLEGEPGKAKSFMDARVHRRNGVKRVTPRVMWPSTTNVLSRIILALEIILFSSNPQIFSPNKTAYQWTIGQTIRI